VRIPINARSTSIAPRYRHALSALLDQAAQIAHASVALARDSPALATSKRVWLTILFDVAMIAAATYVAFWLRFEGNIPPEYLVTYRQTVPWLLVVRELSFLVFGLYGGLWRYTGIWDLTCILLAVFASSLVLYGTLYFELGPAVYPRSVVAIDALLLVWFLGGVRLFPRLLASIIRPKQGRRVLIIGAGDAGDMVVHEMLKIRGYQPVGFIDDDPSKLGRTIQGVTVLGTRADLPRVVAATRPDEVLIAIPSATADMVRSCVQLLEGFKLPLTTLPSLAEIVNGGVGVKQIRPLAIEDLLPRSQVAIDTGDGLRLVNGKRVLVTGAGGSIGSELCRQIASFEPSDLILYERYENSLYAIAGDLADRGVVTSVHPVIGDVTDVARMTAVFAQYRPHLVFHAAAHKHVPLMEANPCEAVKNNVVGTQVAAKVARDYGVERFVLVSTDKAVNPSSVMGASKRVAELIVQAIDVAGGNTRFVTVRFGNVLGSNGSVIPRMLDQIRAGGPVTVTHPEIRRYFMLIPEAVQLVLQAAILAEKRETFVLDMGEQIKVLDVAQNLIRLSGFVPGHEMPIRIIGLRPGEKLFEELVGGGEELEPSRIDKIFRVRRTEGLDLERLADHIEALVGMALLGESKEVLRGLKRIVPTFDPGVTATTESPSGSAALSSRSTAGQVGPIPTLSAPARVHSNV
jgi:FlaA1/EpsC-like NDP-sugar epimerase